MGFDNMVDYEEKEDEADIYSEESRNEMVEDDEMTPEEEGFMEGFESGSRSVSCAHCKKLIIDPDDAIEVEIDNKVFLFCSDECYQSYKEEHKGEEK